MSRPLPAIIRTWLAPLAREWRRKFFRIVWGMDIGPRTHISFSARLDKTNPRGIHIGEETTVNFGAALLTHDFVNGRHLDVWIGRRCLIGANAIIYPGVHIGDNSIVSAGSVVMKDMPSNCIIAGNPARVVETGIETAAMGQRIPKTPDRPELAARTP